MQVDKELAIKLRLQGKTYDQICEAVGCTLDWCKYHLKGLKRKDITESDFKELVAKGRSPDCVTPSDINNKLIITEGETTIETKKIKRNTSRRVSEKLKAEEGVIVRQRWIHPKNATDSYNNMLSYINMLNDTLDEYVRSYLYEVGFSDTKEYDSALAFMVNNSQYGQRILRGYPNGVFESLANSVEAIEERNGSTPFELEAKSTDFLDITEDELPY